MVVEAQTRVADACVENVDRRAVAWRLKSLMWYLRRPRLYRQMVRNLGARLVYRSNDTHAAAKRWCAARAVSATEAIVRITGQLLRQTLAERFPDVFAEAQRRAADCPVYMGGAACLDLLYSLAEHCAARRVIETGVAYGWSSLALLLSMAQRNGSLLISTDMPYTNRNNDRYVGCVVPDELRSRWRIIDRADRDALPLALRQSPQLDLCHYDSDKSDAGRMWAYPRLWAALRPQGTFISDDIGDNLAFCDFARQTGIEPIVVETAGKYAGVLVKP